MPTVLSDNKPAMMPWQDPLQAKVPAIRDGYMGAVYYGQRRSGDFYDFLRSSPQRVLFGLFDVAGDLQQTRPIVVTLQQNFRDLGSRLLAVQDANESEAILELWIEMNRALMKAAGGVHSCPAFLGCYNDDLGTMCYVNSGHTRVCYARGRKSVTLMPRRSHSASFPIRFLSVRLWRWGMGRRFCSSQKELWKHAIVVRNTDLTVSGNTFGKATSNRH